MVNQMFEIDSNYVLKLLNGKNEGSQSTYVDLLRVDKLYKEIKSLWTICQNVYKNISLTDYQSLTFPNALR